MSKKSLVDSIEIKSPCSESWDAMTGNEKVRFCSHCSKNVNDLSQMTRKKAMRLVRDSGGNLCVRYVKNPVNNQPIFAEKLYQITRRAGLAAGVLGTSLAFSTLTYAQGKPRIGRINNEMTQTENLNDKNKTLITTGSIEGTITDETGAVIPNVKITLTNQQNETTFITASDSDGFYEFNNITVGTYYIDFEISGFRKSRLFPSVSLDRTTVVSQIMKADENQTVIVMGDVAFVEHRNPLHQAVANDNFEEAKNLIINGASVNQKDENYNNITPIFLAVENGNVELAELLLNFGAKINVRDDNKQTPLMRLDSDASAELVRILLRRGARINAVDVDGNTPLISAAENSAGAEVLQILLDSGANINAQNKQGQNAIMYAAENGNLESVRTLILAGADVNLKNKEGETAWDLTSDEEIEKLLESYGATMDEN